MIRCTCPTCGAAMEAPDDQGGRRTTCAECGRSFELPAPTYRTVVLPWEDREPSAEPQQSRPSRRPSPPQVDELEEVEPVDEDDDDNRRRRPRGRDHSYDRRDRYDRYRGFKCPFCGSRDEPRITKRLGGASIALIIIGVLFWPLILIGILIQENWLTCRDCGERVRQLDGTYGF